MSGFLDGVNARTIARSGVVAVCLALVVWTTWWAMQFADVQAASPRPGLDIGAIIAAVNGSSAALLNFVFKNYLTAGSSPPL